MELAPVVQRDIIIDEEPFVLVVTTHHEDAVATTAIHRNDFERHIGGARFVESAKGLRARREGGGREQQRRAARRSERFGRAGALCAVARAWRRGAQSVHRGRVPTDIFVPAARTDVLAMADELPHVRETENQDVRDVADFQAATGVRLIVEGANHPISTEAEHWLESQGVQVLPDFIVNCGGLIGCWVEWEARHRDGLHPSVDLHAIGRRALERIQKTVTNNVKELLAANMRAREAAEQIVKRNREKLLSQR